MNPLFEQYLICISLNLSETHPSIGGVRVKHTRKLITLKGTIIRFGGIKMLEGEREYQM